MNPDKSKPKRAFLDRGEWITLAGMALSALSPALAWQNRPPSAVGAAGAVYVSTHNYTRAGFDLSVGFIRVGIVVVLCAVICGALLLFEPPASKKPTYFVIQIACAGVILLLALLNLAPQLGVGIAIAGGALLVWGAFERY